MLIFELSQTGRIAKAQIPSNLSLNKFSSIPENLLRKTEIFLPQVSELQVVRHFTHLSQKNFSIDTHFYPLGSCTMKYNPKFTEAAARLAGFADLHPLLPQLAGGEKLTQGALEVLYETERWMCEMTGFSAFTLQPL